MIFKNKLVKIVLTTLTTIAIGAIAISNINYINREKFKISEKLKEEIAFKSTKITTKNQLILDLNNFNPKIENNNPIIYVLDSDNNKLDNKHGSNTIETIYGLIKNKEIKETNINYVSLLLGSNRYNLQTSLNNSKQIFNSIQNDYEKESFKDDNLEFNIFDFYKLASEKTPNNPVIINQSFVFNPNSKEKIFNSIESINFIKDVHQYNFELLDALKKYKNLSLSISAGNNDFDFISSKVDDYNNKLLKYSNNDFDKYKTLTTNLNKFISYNTILNDESINKLNEKLKENNINISVNELKELINDSVLDYLNNFEKTDLVNQLNELNYYDYKNLEGRIMIVESLSLLKFKENVNQQSKLLDEFPKEILEFYNKINILDLNNFHLNKNQIDEFQNIIDKYSKDYPELFLINNYGSNSNLENRIKSEFIDIAPLYPNTDSSFILGYSGTSSGAAIITGKTINKIMEENKINKEKEINRGLSSF